MSKLSLIVKSQPHVLTIAGSDSSGGAGIQADLKTIAAFQCYGSSVLTGLTAQNTLGVQAVHEVPADFVCKQLQSVFDDESPQAIKLGMLTSASTVHAIANFLGNLPSKPPIILDPVMVSTSGHALLPDDAKDAIKTKLLSVVDWITPNIPEAQALTACTEQVSGLGDLMRLAEKVAATCDVPVVLLKGGHLAVSRKEVGSLDDRFTLFWEEGDDNGETIEVLNGFREYTGADRDGELVVDILVQRDPQRYSLFVGRKIESTSTHGTGCTLSSALACAWAIEGYGPRPSDDSTLQERICKRATAYTRSAIATAYRFGKGHGPLHHSHLNSTRALAPPTSHNPHPFLSRLIQTDLPLWKSYVQHPFVIQLGEGTLPQESFQHYIKQDYLYLRHYARAHSLGAYKSSSFEDIRIFTDIAGYITKESDMHVAYCSSFGITLSELLNTPESTACAAYARYILDVGAQGDILELYMAVASCLVGYGEAKLEGNPYRRWIEDYSGPEFLAAVNRGIENLERRVAEDPPSPTRLAKLMKIWHDCVRLERDFWQMGLSKSW